MKRIAVILSGCGVYDGAEIHESTLTLLSIAQQGAESQCFAPDIQQAHVINHLTGEVADEKRNVLIEAARIARGNIKPLSEYDAKDFDAIILPGGFGVAKNLCTFAFDGADCYVNSEVEQALKASKNANIPIGAWCIAPALLAKVLKDVTLTIGQDKDTAAAIEKLGNKHEQALAKEVIIDKNNKVVTTPCYMLDVSIVEIADGINKAVGAVLELT